MVTKLLPDDVNTIPSALLWRSRETGDVLSIRKKRLGIWVQYSWRHVFNDVEIVAGGLRQLGISRGDRVAILGDNDMELLIFELALQSIGALPLPLYADMTKEEVGYVMKFSGSTVVLARDQEQVDKVVGVMDELKALERVIYVEEKGMRRYKYPWLMSFNELRSLGKAYVNQKPGEISRLAMEVIPEDIAVLSLTSGTTGQPKLAMITHSNLLSAARLWSKVEEGFIGGDYVSVIPFAWIGEQVNVAIWLHTGRVYNFPENPDTLWIDLREIGPTALPAPPRFWERLQSDIEFRARDSTWLKRMFYDLAMRIGYRVVDLETKGKRVPMHYRLLHRLFYLLVYRQILDKVGLKRIKLAVTGGGVLGEDYIRFFRALGVDMRVVYGLTETTALGTIHRKGKVKLGTAGEVVPGMEVRISPEGEIQVRGPGVFKGYYNNEAATKESFTEDGWFRTGDYGFFDEDGHLVVMDRMKDLSRLVDGTVFSPTYVETKIKFNPFIGEAVVYGEGKPYLTAILCINYNTVSKWAERAKVTFTDYADLSQKHEVLMLLRDIIRETNERLPSKLKIKSFVSLPKELDADDMELTRTRKLRRAFVYRKYASIFEAMYRGLDEVDVEIPVIYEDGTVGIRKARIRVVVI